VGHAVGGSRGPRRLRHTGRNPALLTAA
jgi:hypothetical protein